MKKELPYFKIGNSFGGNQDWFRDPFMRMGGCGAASACDTCINLALYRGKEYLYPYNIHKIDKEDYIQFSIKMKPYLRPRMEGIKTLDLFIDGFQKYLTDVGEADIRLEGFSGDLPALKAKDAIRKQIDLGIPVPYLLLRHKNINFKDYVWHWFLLVGYEEYEKEFYVKTATYGHHDWFSLEELWDTGYREKGGMIIVYPDGISG